MAYGQTESQRIKLPNARMVTGRFWRDVATTRCVIKSSLRSVTGISVNMYHSPANAGTGSTSSVALLTALPASGATGITVGVSYDSISTSGHYTLIGY